MEFVAIVTQNHKDCCSTVNFVRYGGNEAALAAVSSEIARAAPEYRKGGEFIEVQPFNTAELYSESEATQAKTLFQKLCINVDCEVYYDFLWPSTCPQCPATTYDLVEALYDPFHPAPYHRRVYWSKTTPWSPSMAESSDPDSE